MRSKNKPFTEQDFKNATREEKIYMKLLQPTDFYLREIDNFYYELIKKTWALLDSGKTAREVANLLIELEHISLFQAMKAVNDAQNILAPLMKVNKDYERAIIAAKAEELYKIAISNNDINAAAKALQVRVKALRLDKQDYSINNIPTELPPVIYSTNEEVIAEAEIIDDEQS